MEVACIVVDWKEAVTRWKSGKLSSEGMETWTEEVDGWIYSMKDYTFAVEAWEFMDKELILRIPAIRRETHFRAHMFMRRLMTSEDRFFHDIGDKGKRFDMSISPETAAQLAAIVKPVDFRVFEKAFRLCPGDDEYIAQQLKQLLKDFARGRSAARCYKEMFLTYVSAWVNAVNTAARKKRGLLISLV
jgi:hypothetical protein